jgi:Phage protein Gp138 N-terminal domain
MSTMPTFSVTVTEPLPGSPSGLTVEERITPAVAPFREAMYLISNLIRVALPCQVISFDATRQVVSVQPTLTEIVRNNGVKQTLALPQLDDVPVVQLGGGGFSITFPIQPGDEALVVFGDMCMDSWWQSGGINNNQIERRRHDLADGFALVGLRSQPRVLSNYSDSQCQLTSDDGSVFIAIDDNGITVEGPAITVKATSGDVDIIASGKVNITEGSNTVDFFMHQHSGVQTGGGQTGPVVP